MKKLFSGFIIMIIFLTGILPQGIFASAANQTGKVTADALNVRSGAGTSYSIVAVIYYGSTVTVTGSANDSSGTKWYKISFSYSGATKTGYVSSSYITIVNNNTGGTTTDKDFEAYMKAQGFPDSYKPMLRTLHQQHPKWIFKAQKLGIDWYEALDEELVLGRNLVHLDSLDSWKSMEKGAYNFTDNYWIGQDGYYWVPASKQIISYYMDPRNFLDDTYIFMFENLSYNSSVHTISGVKAILANTFMKGNFTAPDTKKTYSYAQTFMDAAAKSGVSPYHLASRCRNEQGVNGAPQSLGTVKGYENYFNFFDINAYATSTMTAAEMGCKYAKTTNPTYLLPWTNQYKSIVGGSIFLGNGYINKEQDTLYLQKFDMVDGGNGYYYHQYMTCVFGQANEAAMMKNAYTKELLNSALEFKIPVYDNMPAKLYPKPTSSGNNNNLLKSLSISGYKLDQAFDKYTMSYTATISDDVTSVKINAPTLDSGAKVSGAGTVSLVDGKNTVKIKVTAPSGEVRTYTITITKKASNYPPAVKGFKASPDINSIKLTWDKVSGAQGYIVYKYDTSQKGFVRVTKTANTNNSYTVSGLNAGTSYKFAIKAYKTINGKEYASKTYPTVTANTYLPVVKNFKASPDINSVKLTWDKVSGAQGYVVYWYDASKSSFVRVTKTATNVNTYTVGNLAEGTSHKFAVRAYKTISGKEVLSKTYPTVTANTYLPVVTKFKASPNINSVKLTWDKVSGAQGYVVYWYDASKSSFVRVTKTATNVNTYTVGNLAEGTSHKFAVRAYKTISGKEVLSKTYPTVTANTYLPVVTKFKASPNINSVKLTWDKVSGAQGYVVYWYDASKSSFVRVTKTATNVNTYTVGNLAEGTSHKFAVRAYKTISGKEVLSKTYPTVTANTYLPAVTNFKATSSDVNKVKLSWTKVSGAEGYIVYKYDSKKGFIRVTKTKNTNNSYTVSGLNKGTSYKFAVKAYKTIDGKECVSKTYPTVTHKLN